MFQAGGELSLVCAFPRRDTCDEVQFIHRTTFAGFLCEHLVQPPTHVVGIGLPAVAPPGVGGVCRGRL